jgi:hypothetical protein
MEWLSAIVAFFDRHTGLAAWVQAAGADGESIRADRLDVEADVSESFTRALRMESEVIRQFSVTIP